jgi:putative FmdB family regulatory protein
MPNYVYKCTACKQVVNIFHSFSEKSTDCELCGAENSLKRDYSTPFTSNSASKHKKQRAGQVVDEFIEQTKKEVKEEKLNREYLDD